MASARAPRICPLPVPMASAPLQVDDDALMDDGRQPMDVTGMGSHGAPTGMTNITGMGNSASSRGSTSPQPQGMSLWGRLGFGSIPKPEAQPQPQPQRLQPGTIPGRHHAAPHGAAPPGELPPGAIQLPPDMPTGEMDPAMQAAIHAAILQQNAQPPVPERDPAVVCFVAGGGGGRREQSNLPGEVGGGGSVHCLSLVRSV